MAGRLGVVGIAFVGVALGATAPRAHADFGVVGTVQVTDRPGVQCYPSISGDIVVWEDHRSDQPGIYGHNLATGQEFPIATGGVAKGKPQINGSIVVWAEGSPATIRGKDLATGSTFIVQEGIWTFQGYQYYTIWDRKVYYAAEIPLGSPYRIYCRDIDTGQRTMVSPAEGDDQTDPDARDGHLVWSDYPRTYILDLNTESLQQLRLAGAVTEPAVVAGDTLYYVADERIKAYNIDSGVFSTLSDIWSGHPAADGSLVIWTAYGHYPSTLLQAMDMITGEIVDVVYLPEGGVLDAQQATEVDGLRVAWTWMNADATDMDIFVTELTPEPATLALLALGGLVVLRRRAK